MSVHSRRLAADLKKVSSFSLLSQSRSYVVVEFPGTDEEHEVAEFLTLEAGQHHILMLIRRGRHGQLDVMKRSADGTLTAEF